jgi:hypothetical protein
MWVFEEAFTEKLVAQTLEKPIMPVNPAEVGRCYAVIDVSGLLSDVSGFRKTF